MVAASPLGIDPNNIPSFADQVSLMVTHMLKSEYTSNYKTLFDELNKFSDVHRPALTFQIKYTGESQDDSYHLAISSLLVRAREETKVRFPDMDLAPASSTEILKAVELLSCGVPLGRSVVLLLTHILYPAIVFLCEQMYFNNLLMHELFSKPETSPEVPKGMTQEQCLVPVKEFDVFRKKIFSEYERVAEIEEAPHA